MLNCTLFSNKIFARAFVLVLLFMFLGLTSAMASNKDIVFGNRTGKIVSQIYIYPQDYKGEKKGLLSKNLPNESKAKISFNLSPNKKYIIDILFKGGDNHHESIDSETLSKFVFIRINAIRPPLKGEGFYLHYMSTFPDK